MPTHRVCSSGELLVGQMKAFNVGRQKFVLYRLSDGFFATQATCSHLFAPLARGNLTADGTVQLQTFHARVNGTHVEVDIPAA